MTAWQRMLAVLAMVTLVVAMAGAGQAAGVGARMALACDGGMAACDGCSGEAAAGCEADCTIPLFALADDPGHGATILPQIGPPRAPWCRCGQSRMPDPHPPRS